MEEAGGDQKQIEEVGGTARDQAILILLNFLTLSGLGWWRFRHRPFPALEA